MTIDVRSADAYFSEDNHLLYAQWARYSNKQKSAALKLGRHVLGNALCRVAWDESTTTESDFPRYDAAIYEQAIYALTACDIIPNSASPTPAELFPKAERGPDGTVVSANPHKLCAPAVRMITRTGGRVAASR